MNQDHYVEGELKHLEAVLIRPIEKPFTVSYWLIRLDRLAAITNLPHQSLRLERLRGRLNSATWTKLAA